jgi:hypothetical protein
MLLFLVATAPSGTVGGMSKDWAKFSGLAKENCERNPQLQETSARLLP